jgi:MoaA/NifB/PqqE/SkfB family radical SAM enzyme
MTRSLPSPSFCVLPWTHRYVSERGRIYPCAFSTESGSALKKENGEYFQLSDLSAAWNSLEMRTLRLEMLSGKKPQGCARCFRLEGFGLQSLREVANRAWSEEIADRVAQSSPSGEAPEWIDSLDLRLGNFCNLRCRMCSPESSRKLAEEFRGLHPELSESYFSELKNLDWFRSAEAREILLKNKKNLRELHFAGGEPFLIPELKDFLKDLLDAGCAQDIILTFNTNLTVLPPGILDFFPHFKQVKIIVSLDAHGDLNDYIRFPSEFNKIENNLRLLDMNFHSYGRLLVCFHVTVQMYNVLLLDKLIQYVSRSFSHFLPFPILSALHWPAYFAPMVLPDALKELAELRLLSLMEREAEYWKSIESRCDYPNGANKFVGSIQGMIRLMKSENQPERFFEFKRATDYFDTSRNQKLVEIVPDFLGHA